MEDYSYFPISELLQLLGYADGHQNRDVNGTAQTSAATTLKERRDTRSPARRPEMAARGRGIPAGETGFKGGLLLRAADLLRSST